MSYRVAEIAKELKRPRATIQFWIDRGLVIPDSVPVHGRGRGRALIFSDRNLLEFAMVTTLQDAGLPLNRIKLVMDILRKGSVEGVNFEDFWINADWGMTKDIACTFLSTGKVLLSIVEPGKGFSIQEKDGEFKSAMFVVLLLGRMKRFSVQTLGGK